jgi:hypothetical protein
MILRRQIGSWIFSFVAAHTDWTTGLNSVPQDGNHILMWETDGACLEAFLYELIRSQNKYHLPNIYVIQSSPGNHFHALCYSRQTWLKACHIISDHPLVDETWFRWATTRGYFTLRVTKKRGPPPEPLVTIRSKIHEDVGLEELVNYETYQYRL